MEEQQLFIKLENELLKKTKEEREALFQKLENKREASDKSNGTTHEKNAPPTAKEAEWMLRELGAYSVKIDLMKSKKNVRD